MDAEIDRWLEFTPQTPTQRGAKSDKSPSGTFGTALPGHVQPNNGGGAPADLSAPAQDAGRLAGMNSQETPYQGSAKSARSPHTADVEMLQAHLTILLTAIHAGCRRGLAQHLERTPAEVTRALLANADGLSLEHWRERCEQAGEAVTLAGLVATYRTLLGQVEALGGDIFPDAAALELALLWRPTAAPGKRKDGAV